MFKLDLEKAEEPEIKLSASTNDPMNCTLPGSSIHGIFQSKVLEWVAIRQHKQQRNGKTLRKDFRVSSMKSDGLTSYREYVGHKMMTPDLLTLFISLQPKHCKTFKTIICKTCSLKDQCNALICAFI